MQNSSKVFEIVRIIVLVVLTGLFVYLFYNEATGDFPSDIPAHVRGALTNEEAVYSLIEPTLAITFTYSGNIGVAILLTFFEMATILLSERMLRALMPDMRKEAVFVLALAVNFAIAIYLPVIHPHFAKGVSTGNAWHNSTFLGMKPVSLAAIWAYLRFVNYLKSENHFLDWVAFTFCVVASGAIKPSFVVVFGPTVVVLCIFDLVREGVSTIKRSLMLAVPFIIVLGILLYQYIVLYVEDSSSGIEFGLARVWRHGHFFFPLGMLQSYAFPLIAVITGWRVFKGDRNRLLALIMFGIALCIYLFLNETGHRMYHGNFGWSLKFADYYLFIVAIVIFFVRFKEKMPFLYVNASDKEQREGNNGVVVRSGRRMESASGGAMLPIDDACAGKTHLAFWPEMFAMLVLSWHVLSGLASIVKILMGKGYS